MSMLRLPVSRNAVLNELLLLLQRLPIHILQHPNTELDISNQHVTLAPTKVLPHHNPQHLEVIRLGRHCVRRHNPPSTPEVPRKRELVVMPLVSVVVREAERHEW